MLEQWAGNVLVVAAYLHLCLNMFRRGVRESAIRRATCVSQRNTVLSMCVLQRLNKNPGWSVSRVVTLYNTLLHY